MFNISKFPIGKLLKIKHADIMIWLGKWLASWLDLLCGSISVVTFCIYRPWWDFKFRALWSEKTMKQIISNRGTK